MFVHSTNHFSFSHFVFPNFLLLITLFVVQVTPMVSMSMVSASTGSMNEPIMLNPSQSSGAMISSQKLYVPVQPHWYFCKIVEHRAMWFPMSLLDSVKLEDAFKKGEYSYLISRLKSQ
jgi:hypothetical protein